jgi:DNA-binding transcriptional LysR family regulator
MLDVVDPRRLMIFRAVVRAGALGAAARELGWTQPAVSQHLRQLERETGCTLLLRGPRGVTPTEAGTLLVARADAIAAQLAMAEEELAGVAALRRGRVRLAAFPSASATLVPRALARLRQGSPGIDVALTEAEPPEALALLADGQVDLALVFGYREAPVPTTTELSWVPLGREPVRLVLPVGRNEGRGSVGLDQLSDEPWIAGCDRCRAHLVHLCEQTGFVPNIRHVTDDYVVVQNLVAAGLGVALLPRSALEAYHHPEIDIRPVRPASHRHLGAIHRVGAETVPAVRALLETLTGASSGQFGSVVASD